MADDIKTPVLDEFLKVRDAIFSGIKNRNIDRKFLLEKLPDMDELRVEAGKTVDALIDVREDVVATVARETSQEGSVNIFVDLEKYDTMLKRAIAVMRITNGG